MKVKNQEMKDVIVITVDNGKGKYKIIRPFTEEISDELVENIITGMYHVRLKKS